MPSGTSLTPSGSLTLSQPGQVVSGLKITGTVTITASNVTLENSEVITASPDDSAIKVLSTATGTVIQDTTVTGAGDGNSSVEYAIMNEGTNTVANRVALVMCTECFAGPGTLENSYADVNATLSGAHYEDSYWGGGTGSLTFEHDTLINTHGGVSTVYASPDKAQINGVTVDNSLLDGGAYTLYGGDGSSTLATNIKLTNNRIATDIYRTGGQYGWLSYFTPTQPGNQLSGNVWDANSVAMPASWDAQGPAEAGPSS